ncbi:MAG: hypothetical protein L0H26_12450 [Microlunatus sp.]|nr:hypothetical protein [Microlunatus sp.]
MHVALIVTGAPLAKRAGDLISALDAAGHHVTVCPSEAARDWTHIEDSRLPTGRTRPDAVVIAPATFNTLNKWAAGINDTPLLGVLNDALGLGTPILAVPMVADRLAAHPAWPRTLHLLTAADVQLLDPTTGARSPNPATIASGTGDDIAARFQPKWLLDRLPTTK